MGLMYIFPTKLDESEHAKIVNKTIILKTYGLPMIFWGYLAASLIVIGTMWLASKSVISKLLTYSDPSLWALAYLVKITLLSSPIILLGFFFFEKQIKKTECELSLIYRIFFIPVFSRKIILDKKDSFLINHFMDSPNIAKMQNKADLKQFENKGHFELHAISNGKIILIDRHSRKAELIKLKEMLASI